MPLTIEVLRPDTGLEVATSSGDSALARAVAWRTFALAAAVVGLTLMC